MVSVEKESWLYLVTLIDQAIKSLWLKCKRVNILSQNRYFFSYENTGKDTYMENDVKKTQTWENQNLGLPVPFPLYPWLKIAFEYSVSCAYF